MLSISYLAAGDANMFRYFLDSNVAGKVIIFLLALASVWAWSVMIAKCIELRRLRRANLQFEKQLVRGALLLDMEISPNETNKIPYARMLAAAIQAFYRYGDDSDDVQRSKRYNQVENALQRVLSRETLFYETKMVLLASIVTGAPFMGLLGTVWGVMDAFGSVAMAGSATLKSLAPGVSGALLTTVAGLVVAIPSVFGYNYLLTQIRRLTLELENFASSLADRLELEARD